MPRIQGYACAHVIPLWRSCDIRCRVRILNSMWALETCVWLSDGGAIRGSRSRGLFEIDRLAYKCECCFTFSPPRTVRDIYFPLTLSGPDWHARLTFHHMAHPPLRCLLCTAPPQRLSCRMLMSLPLMLPLLIIALLPESSYAQFHRALSTATSAEPGAHADCQQPPYFHEQRVNDHQGKSLILKDVCLEQVGRID